MNPEHQIAEDIERIVRSLLRRQHRGQLAAVQVLAPPDQIGLGEWLQTRLTEQFGEPVTVEVVSGAGPVRLLSAEFIPP